MTNHIQSNVNTLQQTSPANSHILSQSVTQSPTPLLSHQQVDSQSVQQHNPQMHTHQQQQPQQNNPQQQLQQIQQQVTPQQTQQLQQQVITTQHQQPTAYYPSETTDSHLTSGIMFCCILNL